MSLVVDLDPKVEEALRKKASAQGTSFDDYVSGVLNKHVAQGPTIDEILEPVRREFEKSGMTEDQLDEFLNGVRQKVHEEKRSNGRS
jgi:hypothetical protein